MTHHANSALPKQGYSHWWKMFNAKATCSTNPFASSDRFLQPYWVRDQALGAFQQYLRNQNMFASTTWAMTRSPHFFNPNYAPKARVIEKLHFHH